MSEEKEILKTKALRKKISDLVFEVEGLKYPANEKQYSLKALKESRMWLGQYLRFLGGVNPYPDSEKQNLKIAPKADI